MSTITVNGRPAEPGCYGNEIDAAETFGVDWAAPPSWETAETFAARDVISAVASRGDRTLREATRGATVYEFRSEGIATWMRRLYRIGRANGASPITARFIVVRDLNQKVGATMARARHGDGSFAHLDVRFADTRDEMSDREDAYDALADATVGGYWDLEDGEMFLLHEEDRP